MGIYGGRRVGDAMGIMIPMRDLVAEMERLLNLSRPEICRHHVCGIGCAYWGGIKASS